MRTNTISGNILYREFQQYRQLWLWILYMLSVILQLSILFINRNNIAASDSYQAFVVSVLAVLIISAVAGFILYQLELEIVVTDDGIFFRWKPFMKKYVYHNRNQITGARIASFPWLKNLRGRHSGHSPVHSVNFSKGLKIILSNGKILFLGSQKLSRLEHEVSRMIALNNETSFTDKNPRL